MEYQLSGYTAEEFAELSMYEKQEVLLAEAARLDEKAVKVYRDNNLGNDNDDNKAWEQVHILQDRARALEARAYTVVAGVQIIHAGEAVETQSVFNRQ